MFRFPDYGPRGGSKMPRRYWPGAPQTRPLQRPRQRHVYEIGRVADHGKHREVGVRAVASRVIKLCQCGCVSQVWIMVGRFEVGAYPDLPGRAGPGNAWRHEVWLTTTSAVAAALALPLPPTASQGRSHPVKSPVQAGAHTWLYWAIRSGVSDDDEGSPVVVPSSMLLLLSGPAVKLYTTSPIKSDRATAARSRYSIALRPRLGGWVGKVSSSSAVVGRSPVAPPCCMFMLAPC